MEYIYEKIRNELKTSLSTAKTIDYYLIKLDSAIYMLKDYIEGIDDRKVKEFLDHVSDLFEPLACHKDVVLSQARSPRFPLLRRYYSVVEEWLESMECRSSKRLVLETPSAPPVYLKEKLFIESRKGHGVVEKEFTSLWGYLKKLFKKITRLFKKQ